MSNRPGRSDGSSADSGTHAAERFRRPVRKIKADGTSRAWALAIDGVFLLVVAFVVMVVSMIASTPFWDVDGKNGHYTPASGVGVAGIYGLSDSVPVWLPWTIAGVMGGVMALLSGAFSKPGHRRSMGLGIAELRLVQWPVDLDKAFIDDFDEPGSVIPVRVPEVEIPLWDPATLEPDRARVAARWLFPFVAFVALVPFIGGMGAGLLVLAGWLPALWGSRRSLYDVATGVAVVDAVRLAGAAADARRS